MAIKRALYKQMNSEGTEFDVLHYQTSAGVVEVLDDDKVSKGNLDSLLMKGVVVRTGDIKDIKVSGKYRIKGVSGLPGGTNSSEEYMLEVVSMGEDINNPILVNYMLTDKNGYMYYRTISETNQDSGWSSGGTGMKNTINSILNTIGSSRDLKTSNQVLVDAINELVDYKDSSSKSIQKLNDRNFDSRYIRRDVTTSVSADTNIQHGKGFNTLLGNGSTVNLIKSDLSGNTVLGNTNTGLQMASRGHITHNGSKVWTAGNDGAGSGLDADLLGGIPSSRYLTTDSNGQFSKNIRFNEGMTIGSGKLLNWSGESGIGVVSFHNNTTTRFMRRDGLEYAKIDSRTGLHSSALSLVGGELCGEQLNSLIEMKGKPSDRGFSLSVDRNNGELKLVNSQNGAVLFNAGRTSSELGFGNRIMINGKHVYIQKNQPPTSAPEGSVWIQTRV